MPAKVPLWPEFFHLYRHPVLCALQRILSFRRQLAVPDTLQDTGHGVDKDTQCLQKSLFGRMADISSSSGTGSGTGAGFSAVIVLRKNATVKVLDILVPIMAACYFVMTVFIIIQKEQR